MGWVLMSERELRRVEVLSSVVARRLTVTAAAAVLGVRGIAPPVPERFRAYPIRTRGAARPFTGRAVRGAD